MKRPAITKNKAVEPKEFLASDNYPKSIGIVVTKNNKLLVEKYLNGFTVDSLRDTRSSFKSATNLLAGIALNNESLHNNK